MTKKESIDHLQVCLLSDEEQGRRLARVYAGMRAAGIGAALVRDNANLYYLTGRVFRGYVYLEPDAEPEYFVRRPTTLRCRREGQLHFIRKPEEIADILGTTGRGVRADVALELDALSYCEAVRLAKAFGGAAPAGDLSPVLRRARAVKTAQEQAMLRLSGERQSLVYERIPHLYREGMTDIEFQIEIERASRLGGCLGQFRVAGGEMELFMGNVLTGENGDTPSPYDFAMGGAGLDPSLPVGADGTVIKPGQPVMVDVNGNYTGYMTDMTRIYYTDSLADEARRACALSADICRELASMMRPGTEAKALYERAVAMAKEGGLGHCFMGHASQAGFVGHGVGIEINELPVIAPRSRDIIEAGNVVALEPKFVIPGIGAVGIENTYIAGSDGGECITNVAETPIELD